MFFNISAWNIAFSLCLIIRTSVAEELNPYNPPLGADLALSSIFPPDDGSSNSLMAATGWTADGTSNGQLNQLSDYRIDGQGLGQLLVGETDRCQPQSNQNRRRIRPRQVCPNMASPMKATGQDTRQNTRIWPSESYPDDLPKVQVPDRPRAKADLEKCDHNRYNTPVCDQGEDSSPNFSSSAGEWTLPNCVPLMPWHKGCAGTEVIWCCEVVELRPPMPSAPDDLNLVHKHSCYRCIRQALLPKKPDPPPPLGESNVHNGNF